MAGAIVFASAKTLAKKDEEKQFDFFGGYHPSTLTPSDHFLMEVERKKSRVKGAVRFSPYDPQRSSGVSEVEKREFEATSKRIQQRPPGSNQGPHMPDVKFLLDQEAFEKQQKPTGSKIITFKDLTPEQQKSLVMTKYKDLISKLSAKSRCVYCNSTFTEADNIGFRKCLWHPGKEVLGKWTCCGQGSDMVSEITQRASGCSLCDHSTREYNPIKTNNTELPLAVARMIGVPEHQIIVLDKNPEQDLQAQLDLERKCVVIRATSTRVPKPRGFRPPPTFRQIPVSDMDLLRLKMEIATERVKEIPEPVAVNVYAGHFTPAGRW